MKTIDKLTTALNEAIQDSATKKIHTTAISKAAGVSHSTVYNRYPEIADRIKAHNMAIAIANDNSTKNKLQKIKAEKVILKEENDELKSDIQRLVSLNAKYELENSKLVNQVSVLAKEISDLNKKYRKITQL